MVGLSSLLTLDSFLNVSILSLTFGTLERNKHYVFLLQAVESQWNIVDDFFLPKQLMTIKNQWKPRAKMWVKLT